MPYDTLYYTEEQSEPFKDSEHHILFLKEGEELMTQRCCICGKEFYGYGNNPEPIKKEGRCCDDCDSNIVTPARQRLWKKRWDEFI